MMSSFMSDDRRVLRERKRPKKTSSKTKTARVPFSESEVVNPLSIPIVADGYNYNIEAVGEFDHLRGLNAGLRHVERGGHQALKHWLLRTVLINCYLLAYYSDVLEPREMSSRSQRDFRRYLIGALLAKGQGSEICPKKIISRISQREHISKPDYIPDLFLQPLDDPSTVKVE